jgi:hypothetical protein
LERGRTVGSAGLREGLVVSAIQSKAQQRTFVGSSMGSSVNGASIVGSFEALEAWKSLWLSCSSYRTRGLPIESKTQQCTFVGSSVGSAVDGASIVGSFVTLGAWKSRWFSWSSFRKLGL